ncbi:Ankyrin repeat, bromo and BTB domain-containing protein [Gracilariopsis chorda]|uniref:Ankyrin repeat, bromo and BTB domain-containing protein n=1 Tax=Gracilariopsis chorda TaxID=448386 RepID=A0A2V3IP49_9FLOR|nr:Ankyrin repeat, bromo and BTB domain-containing protein [Gracilariopsis chorda]|eukprot:PXF43829.1 Ankyrin repeat, bromo and BTB domain-containing protein [Gracilariopsis chorda]
MHNIWEDLPASPCSAASDEPNMRASRQHNSSRPNLLKPRPPTLTLPDLSKDSYSPREPSSPNTKRARIDDSAKSLPVGFVEANTPSSDHTSDLVTRLNHNADEERRRFLLEKLQAIQSRKAALKASPSADEDVVFVSEKNPTPKPQRKTVARNSRKRKQAPRRRTASSARVPSKSPAEVPQIINVDVDASLPTPSTTTQGNKASPCAAKPANMEPTRQSSRIRRPRTAIDETPADKPVPLPTCMSKCKRLQFCKRLVTSMIRDPSTNAFASPVKELWHEAAIPRYFEIIKQPMDLRTVKRKLETTAYIEAVKDDILPYRFDAEAFAHDVRLIFRNAMVYNRVGDMLYNSANMLQKDFNNKFSEGLPPPPSPEEISSKLCKKRSTGVRGRKGKQVVDASSRMDTDIDVVCVSGPSVNKRKSAKATRRKAIAAAREIIMHSDPDTMSREEIRERLGYLERCRVPVLARTPVAKGAGYLTRAALLYEEEMSFDEKKRCGDAVTNVPPSKLPALLSIIQKSYKEGEKGDGEVELDMDRLDNRTMRNIEAFLEHTLPNFKTVRSSSLGREFSCLEEIEEEMKDLRARLGALKKSSSSHGGRECKQVVAKPRSFFDEAKNVNYSSSDSSSGEESDSESSDDSDSDSE